MSKFIYTAIQSIFGDTLIADVKDCLVLVLGALQNIFTHDQISVMVSIFLLVAGALAILHIYMDLVQMATNDMLSIEKLMIEFIKILAVFTVLIYLEDIIKALFDLAIGFYQVLLNVADSQTHTGLSGIMFLGYDLGNGFPEWELVMEEFNEAFGSSPLDFLNNITIVFTLFIPNLLSGVCKLACYFAAISSALTLIIMVIFAPIGVVNCFDEGMRGAGIKYLKTFLATALTFAIIIGVLYASTLINSSVIVSILRDNGISNIADSEALDSFTGNFSVFYILTGIRLASVGVILKSLQIAKNIIGV